MPRPFHAPQGRENARPHEEYATVRCIIANRTDRAICITADHLVQAVWVPVKALDMSGRLTANRAALKSEIKIGIELELALKKGLV